jgi:hypothetical protein
MGFSTLSIEALKQRFERPSLNITMKNMEQIYGEDSAELFAILLAIHTAEQAKA